MRRLIVGKRRRHFAVRRPHTAARQQDIGVKTGVRVEPVDDGQRPRDQRLRLICLIHADQGFALQPPRRCPRNLAPSIVADHRCEGLGT